MARASPNIIVTVTPEVGKTPPHQVLAERTGLRHISVSRVVKDEGCHEGWDDEHQSWIVDEDEAWHISLSLSLFFFLFGF